MNVHLLMTLCENKIYLFKRNKQEIEEDTTSKMIKKSFVEGVSEIHRESYWAVVNMEASLSLGTLDKIWVSRPWVQLR